MYLPKTRENKVIALRHPKNSSRAIEGKMFQQSDLMYENKFRKRCIRCNRILTGVLNNDYLLFVNGDLYSLRGCAGRMISNHSAMISNHRSKS